MGVGWWVKWGGWGAASVCSASPSMHFPLIELDQRHLAWLDDRRLTRTPLRLKDLRGPPSLSPPARTSMLVTAVPSATLAFAQADIEIVLKPILDCPRRAWLLGQAFPGPAFEDQEGPEEAATSRQCDPFESFALYPKSIFSSARVRRCCQTSSLHPSSTDSDLKH